MAARLTLLDAIRNNSVEAAQELLAHGCNINERDNQQNTPLIHAASKGAVPLVRLLLSSGADVNCQNSSGHTALTRACAAGKVEVAQQLLQARGTQVDLQDAHGNSALLWCARTGNVQLVKILVEAGARVNLADHSGRTPIFHAAVAASLSVAQTLVSAGADLTLRDYNGKTALDYAGSNVDMRSLLQSAAANAGGGPGGGSGGANGRVMTPSGGFPVSGPAALGGGSLGGGTSPNATRYASFSGMATPGTPVSSISGAATAPGGVLQSPSINPRMRNGSYRPSAAYQQLCAAIQAGDEKQVELLMGGPPGLDGGGPSLVAARDMLQNYPMHVAAGAGQTAILGKLLEAARGMDFSVDTVNMDGHTPLYLAARLGHRPCVQSLLAAGANVNVASHEQSTALHVCMHPDIVRLLLDRGANVNAADSHAATPLVRAAEVGHANVCSLLLRQGANINHRRRDGSTALLVAVRGSRHAVVQVLLAAGANPNIADAEGETPLIEAATSGSLGLVQTLVSHGVDVQMCNHIGETALMRASVHASAAIADELIGVGARLDAADRELGFTALMYAASQGSSAVVARLLAAGAAVGHANNMGISALLLASRSGYLEVVEQLLQAGASIDQADLKGYTPLMVACVGGYTAVVSHLLAKGANVNLRNYEGYTALSAALEFGQKAVAELLVKHGADTAAIGAGQGAGAGGHAPGSLKASSQVTSVSGGLPEGGAGGTTSGASGRLPIMGQLGGEASSAAVGRGGQGGGLLQQLGDGLPNSVSTNNLVGGLGSSGAGEGCGVGGTGAVEKSQVQPLSHASKFLQELDAYEVVQRRSSKANMAPLAGGAGLGLGLGAREGGGGGTSLSGVSSPRGSRPMGSLLGGSSAVVPVTEPSASTRLQQLQQQQSLRTQQSLRNQQSIRNSMQLGGGGGPPQQLQLSVDPSTGPAGGAGGACGVTDTAMVSPVDELVSHASSSSDLSKDVGPDKHGRGGGAQALKGPMHANGGSMNASLVAGVKPLFKRSAGQPENAVVLDPHGPDLFEPGQIYRSPWAKVVSFRDPGADDVIWYEPSESGEERQEEGAGEGGCGCVIS